jgi:aminoglycoside phosphotransferase (APT) family kinase protein
VTSPTQQALRPHAVAELVRSALGVAVAACIELGGGGFASVWRVSLTAGGSVVVKVGPHPDVPLLGYESVMVRAEAEYLRLVEAGADAVPVPRVLRHGEGGPVAGEWLITTWLPGTPLPELANDHPGLDDGSARRDLGAAVAAIHRITGDRYGYTGNRPQGATWLGAFSAIMESLLQDAVSWRVELPSPPARVRAEVDRAAGVLAAVRRPALLHFDLWDGNVLVAPDRDGRARLTGLVDGERYLLGDELMDFVSPVLMRRIEDEPDHPFVRGYAAASGAPVVFDQSARHRLALYRLHLYLLMLVEMPSRGMVGPGADARRERLTSLFLEELDRLCQFTSRPPPAGTVGCRAR